MAGKFVLFLLMAATTALPAGLEQEKEADYRLAIESFQLLKEALIEELGDSLLNSVEVLEEAALQAEKDSLYETAIGFLEDANLILEAAVDSISVREIPMEPARELEILFETENSVSLNSGFSRYGRLLDENNLPYETDTSNTQPNEWTAGGLWDFSLLRQSPGTEMKGTSFLWLNNETAENRLEGKFTWSADSWYALYIKSELMTVLGLPGNSYYDSTSRALPGAGLGCIVWKKLDLSAGMNAGLHKYQRTHYANFTEPWARIALISSPLPFHFHTDGALLISQKRHMSTRWKSEDENRAQANLSVSYLPTDNFAASLMNYGDWKKGFQKNDNGNFLLLENTLNVEKSLRQWISLSAEGRCQQSYYVTADSTGGYRYYNRILSALPGLTLRQIAGFQVFLGYDIALSSNNDGTRRDVTGITMENYQQEGLKLEIQWMGTRHWFSIGNHYEYREAVNGETVLNPDEISNNVNSFFEYRFNTRWTLSTNAEWNGRWQHTGAQEPDIVGDLSLSYRF